MLLGCFEALCDASIVLRFPSVGDSEQLPDNHRHVAVCCGALREASVTVLGELELPVSGDPIHLPEELCRIPFQSGALAKQVLVRGVQEAFMLTRSHYDGVRFDGMSHGFPDCYSAEALDAFATEVSEPAERFANALVPTLDA